MISDDDLLLYYYRDGLEPDDRARIGAALSEQPELAQRLHRLVARLDAVASLPEVPVPAHVRQRWQAALERAARSSATRAASKRHRWAANARWQAAAAGVAVLALILTLQLTMQSSPNRTVEEAALPTTDALAGTDQVTAYERSLRWHLASTERQLTTLEGATPDERTRLIETIIAQNRMYALAAERAGEPQLARVLRAFAPILESVVRDAGKPSASSLARLSFELRVLQARLSADADKPTSAQPLAL